MKSLNEWPRPSPDSGEGLHVLTKAGNQIYCSDGIRSVHAELWKKMGVCWLLVLTDGDSQLRACDYFRKQGFEVILRPYKPFTWDVPPVDLLKKFADVGVRYSLPYTNEPEIEQPRPPTAEIIDLLATTTIKHADNCAHAGLQPVTPSIQGDRVYSWFEPLVKHIIFERKRRDALEGSAIGIHNRPANHEPSVPPPGFVFRSYELFNDVIVRYLGQSLPIFGTEAGYEPHDRQDITQPPISIDLHTRYNVEIAQMQWRPALFNQCFWTFLPDWFYSGWWENQEYGTLPVVNAFVQMPKVQRWPKEEEPEQELPESEAIIQIRNWCWQHVYPESIEYNAEAAFQQQTTFAPCTKELHQWGWSAQGFSDFIYYCREGSWDKIKKLSWGSGPKLT